MVWLQIIEWLGTILNKTLKPKHSIKLWIQYLKMISKTLATISKIVVRCICKIDLHKM